MFASFVRNRCGHLVGSCICQIVRNVPDGTDRPDADAIDKARPASRSAALATARLLPDAGSSSRTDAHDRMALLAAKALHRVNAGNLDGAAKAHSQLAGLHDRASEDALFAGDTEDSRQHAQAADAHRRAAAACSAGTIPIANASIDGAYPPPVLNFREDCSPGLLAALDAII